MQIMNQKSYNMYDFILKMDPTALEIYKGFNNIWDHLSQCPIKVRLFHWEMLAKVIML